MDMGWGKSQDFKMSHERGKQKEGYETKGGIVTRILFTGK